MIEYKILAIPSEMPQKFIVGYRKQEDCLVYCPSYKYASEEEDRGHNETARDAGFDISEGEYQKKVEKLVKKWYSNGHAEEN